jgi:hypothetical protein
MVSFIVNFSLSHFVVFSRRFSRRPGLSKNWTPALWSKITTPKKLSYVYYLSNPATRYLSIAAIEACQLISPVLLAHKQVRLRVVQPTLATHSPSQAANA